MRFRASFPKTSIANAALVYRANEYSFDVEPQQENFASILVNDLNIEVNSSGRVTSVWGVCPHMSWVEATITPPKASFGDLYLISEAQLVAGVSSRPDKQRWPVYVDKNSGWVLLDCKRKSTVDVEILSGVVIGIDDSGELAGIWLRPVALP